ncbi:hypothetical protein L1987_52606 [Smallanthus sonchifolius]|uniref:Uncharacterized protein n=1 Tax=Smallanthus sonchifolius TaxID=185202 RepID=A0ACB9ETL5_9ASTR|nr:hypothetical protein L1987_52606 [Smallanthus sonchifolius]
MIQDCEDSSKKRKRDGSLQQEDFFSNYRASTKTNCSKRLVVDTELHLDTPMPLEWQRCLDIKSGQIHYYNTRTHKKTSMDPRNSPEADQPPKNMSLDLELNLKHHVADNFSKYKTSNTTSNNDSGGGGGGGDGDGGGGDGAPSWLTLEGGDQQQEMMTAVCKKCHMLVMMFKISPSCPNCKFMHPPNQTPTSLFNRELSLLC